MPRIRYAKKSSKKVSRPRRTGPKRAASSFTTTRTNFSRVLFAPRNFVQLRMGIQGYVGAGAIAYGNGSGRMTINATEFLQPFNSVIPFNSSNMGGTLSGATLVTNVYPGTTSVSNMYNGYRVHRYRVTVRCAPTNNGDQVLVVHSPLIGQSGIGSYSSGQIQGNPYSKTHMAIAGSDATPSLSGWIDCRVVNGMTKAQFSAQSPAVITFNTAPLYGVQHEIQWSTVDGGSLSGNLVWDIIIEAQFEFSNPSFLNS